MVTKIVFMRFQHSPIKTVGGVRENVQNRRKNANDFHDLDFDHVTLRSLGYVDLDYTHRPQLACSVLYLQLTKSY